MLVKITAKLNDQLNRLRVEELALLNVIRSEKDQETSASKQPDRGIPGLLNIPASGTSGDLLQLPEEETSEASGKDHALPLLDLDVTKQLLTEPDDMEEEEEEEEEEDANDQLTEFMKQLERQSDS